ncbi:MAG TPA: flavodoxin domain-containing protein [Candidatus Limnocylindrales bacterium]|nr:flavodoxin domain-containing protein [Candidatus Limnocylindrales bacterium]
MKVLVAYASRHGATQGIAERIASTIRQAGLDVELEPASGVRSLDGYDAFVIGSAAYMFHWLKDGVDLVHRNRATLAGKPVWLFSSGPLGTKRIDAKGRDQMVTAIPKEIDGLVAEVHAREHRVFFGAYSPDQKPVGLAERFLTWMPAAREGMPAGDFRDWPEIEAWARSIATVLNAASAAGANAPSVVTSVR